MFNIFSNKFSYYSISSLNRFATGFHEELVLQNYTTNNLVSITDFFIKISITNIIIFFFLIATNLLYTYDELINITCIDNINLDSYDSNIGRFSLFYTLIDISRMSRLTVFFSFNSDIFIPSISSIYKSSNWLEREIFDLFGIYFINHNDLRRILTDYGFQGYPLRKDFPMFGFLEVEYSTPLKQVFYVQIKHLQKMKEFFLYSN